MKRFKTTKKKSKKLFTKTARKVNYKNLTNPKRGGIRM